MADGPNPSEGHVEICYQNVWGVIYDENWTTNDTAVVCSQLGFDRYGLLRILCMRVLIIILLFMYIVVIAN